MKVRHLISKPVITVDISTPLHDVAELMKQNCVGIVTVTENGKLKGVITNRDLVSRVLAEGPGALRLSAKHVMTSNPITVSDESEVANAVDKMRAHHVRQVVIAPSEETIVGVVSLDDIWRHDPSMLGERHQLPTAVAIPIGEDGEAVLIRDYFLG